MTNELSQVCVFISTAASFVNERNNEENDETIEGTSPFYCFSVFFLFLGFFFSCVVWKAPSARKPSAAQRESMDLVMGQRYKVMEHFITLLAPLTDQWAHYGRLFSFRFISIVSFILFLFHGTWLAARCQLPLCFAVSILFNSTFFFLKVEILFELRRAAKEAIYMGPII